ncbi:hypothetical protein Q9966_004972 [Columba livia]|nr:hypothetical protein Q9966_004972 [Columba livia]
MPDCQWSGEYGLKNTGGKVCFCTNMHVRNGPAEAILSAITPGLLCDNPMAASDPTLLCSVPEHVESHFFGMMYALNQSGLDGILQGYFFKHQITVVKFNSMFAALALQ